VTRAGPAGVPRETPAGLAAHYGLPAQAAERFERLVEALAAEPDPPTTVRAPAAALCRHVADSLSGLAFEPLVRARAIADVGAGAGFPGLALAAALPSARVDLVESAARKCAVIERLAAAADIGNARAVLARAEEWAAGEGAEAYDAVTARAVAALPVLVEYAAPLLAPGGALVAWKGAREEGEERAGAAAARLLGLEPHAVLGVEPFAGAHSRHLHVYVKVRPTPERVPRRAGAAAKRPLA
jgi:16S rRNA (guanine527-N7)-methyltransferase